LLFASNYHKHTHTHTYTHTVLNVLKLCLYLLFGQSIFQPTSCFRVTKWSIFCQSHEYQVLSRTEFTSLGFKMLKKIFISHNNDKTGTTLRDVS